MAWLKIDIAPFGQDLEVAVVDGDRFQPVVFPCRRTLYGWVKAASGAPVEIHPTHWRYWQHLDSRDWPDSSQSKNH